MHARITRIDVVLIHDFHIDITDAQIAGYSSAHDDQYFGFGHLDFLSIAYQEYGPRNRLPLKWIMCSGASAIQTSVSHAMSAAYFL